MTECELVSSRSRCVERDDFHQSGCSNACRLTNGWAISPITLARIDPSQLLETDVRHYDIKANWKIFVENYIDSLTICRISTPILLEYVRPCETSKA